MKAVSLSPTLRAAFASEEMELRLRHARVGCMLALVLVPAGVTLDYFVYPHLLGELFRGRLLCDLLLVPAYLILFHPLARKFHISFSNLWSLFPTWMICWMIWRSEGAVSSYYAGLNLMVVVTSLLLPYSLVEAISYCTLVLSSYGVACWLHKETPFQGSIFFNNLYFLTLTSIICATACHFAQRRRVEDFLLRQKLDEQNLELQQTNQRLAVLDKMKSDFFSNVSHEFRTPLAVIIGQVDHLFRTGGSFVENVHQSLTAVLQNAQRLLKLVNELLELVKMDARGGVHFNLQPVNLSSFVPGLVDSMRYLATSKGISMRVETEQKPVVARADPDRLEKVLVNLLSNAIKFTNAGGWITTRCHSKGDRAWVEIEDTGEGISASELPRIFDRFYQVDGAQTRHYQGVGLGLALSRELVEKQGGSMQVDSVVGVGSKFRFDLPLVSEADDCSKIVGRPIQVAPEDILAAAVKSADRILQRPEFTEDLATMGSGKRTILVVDDEPDMRHFLAMALAREHTVLQATDGPSGLELARKKHPDLLLLDWMLPGMTGLEVCKCLRNQHGLKDLKILILTARMDEQSKIDALQAGADDFLTKPFSSIELETRINGLLRASLLQKELVERNRELEFTLETLKRTEGQLIQSEKMNAVGTLAAGLLHEINNPLNFTLAAMQYAKNKLPDESIPPLKEALVDAEQGMSRIRDIILDLKLFAHPDRGSMPEPFDVGEMIDSALRLIGHQLDGVTIERGGEKQLKSMGMPRQLAHLVMNLVMNSSRAARKMAELRDPLVKISTESDASHWRLRIWDNGHGIPSGNLTKVMDPFFSTTEVGQGMGLGLSVCHTVVKNHHGIMVIQSSENEWTEVVCEFPNQHQEQPKT